MKPLKPYHHIWLCTHPHRTEEWLRNMSMDGFDIHHLDGDHSNDSPLNLVLIESADHLRLHGQPNMIRMLRTKKEKNIKEKLNNGESFYKAKLKDENLTWLKIGRKFGKSENYTYQAARLYALENGLRWPFIMYNKKTR